MFHLYVSIPLYACFSYFQICICFNHFVWVFQSFCICFGIISYVFQWFWIRVSIILFTCSTYSFILLIYFECGFQHFVCVFQHFVCVFQHLVCVFQHVVCVFQHFVCVFQHFVCIFQHFVCVFQHLVGPMCVSAFCMCVSVTLTQCLPPCGPLQTSSRISTRNISLKARGGMSSYLTLIIIIWPTKLLTQVIMKWQNVEHCVIHDLSHYLYLFIYIIVLV